MNDWFEDEYYKAHLLTISIDRLAKYWAAEKIARTIILLNTTRELPHTGLDRLLVGKYYNFMCQLLKKEWFR